jgi:8-oxo-dGTP pyrophosphatase MutT (NUDIX family)
MNFPLSVKAVVEVDGRVPLLRNERSEWELPGGRLELGEELEAAAEREVREELGLSVECRALVDAWTYHPAGSMGTVVIVVYDCALRTPLPCTQPLTLSPEHTDAQWFEVASLGAVEMPAPYKASISRAATARRWARNPGDAPTA